MVRLTDCLDMTIAVDWDVKLQIKKNKKNILIRIYPFAFYLKPI